MVKDFLWRLVHLEPTMMRTFVVTIFALLAATGVVVNDSLPDALVSAVIALAAIIQAVWVRQGVTANARVVVEAPDPVDQPGLVAPGQAVTMADDASIIEAATTEREE
jgi:hypothetical protein